MDQNAAKRMAAKRALEFVKDGMRVGLGTGSTATMFIEELGARVKAEGLRVRCVASSDASHALAEKLGIPVGTFVDVPELDVEVDGADEVARLPGGGAGAGLGLIKGGGGALLREKIVASAARTFVVVADATKKVERLGRFPLPVEVIQLALPLVQRRLEGMGLRPGLRRHKDGSDYVTDEGNFILDCACGEIADPAAVATEIRGIVGVVEHGLFLGVATVALIAGETGVEEMWA